MEQPTCAECGEPIEEDENVMLCPECKWKEDWWEWADMWEAKGHPAREVLEYAIKISNEMK